MPSFVVGYQPSPIPSASVAITNTYETVTLTALDNAISPRFLVQAGDILESIEIYAKAASPPTSGTITAAAYVTDLVTNIAGARLFTGGTDSKKTFTTASGTSQWHLQSVELDLTPWAGSYIKPCGGYSAGSGVRFHYGTVTIGDARSIGSDCPTPLATSTTRINAPLVRMTIRRAAYTISSVNGDDTITPGQVNTAAVVGYVAGVNPIVSGTVGSLALTSVSQASTTASFTPPAPTSGAYWPEPDTTKTLTLTDGTNPATFNAPFNSLGGFTSVPLVDPDNADIHKLPYHFTIDAVDDDRIMYKPADLTVGPDGGITDATLDIVTPIYHWVAATSFMYEYAATLYNGQLVDVRSLTSVGLSSPGLTSAGLTSVGL